LNYDLHNSGMPLTNPVEIEKDLELKFAQSKYRS
jgi:hypothetical protein